MRTSLTIIMMMFFATLTLDLAVPAAILTSLMALDWLSSKLKRGFIGEGRTA